MPNAHTRVLSHRPTRTGWLLGVPQAICKGLDATVGPYAGSWPWGGDVDDVRPRGEQDHKNGVCNGLGSLVGSPRDQKDPCSLKNSSPGGPAPGLSPSQPRPVSGQGERGVRWKVRTHPCSRPLMSPGVKSWPRGLSRRQAGPLGGRVRLLL